MGKRLALRGELPRKRSDQAQNGSREIDLWMTLAATALATLLIVAATQAQGQTFSVIHSFSGHANANLYGTAFVGGNPGAGCYYGFNCGVVFEIAP